MDCRTAQRELGAGLDRSPEVEAHVAHCDGCREFAGDLETLRAWSESTVTTPVDLRERTFDRCRAILAEGAGARRMSPATRIRRILDSPRFVAATAALSVLILVVLTVSQIDDIQGNDPGFLLRLTVVQFIMQNFTAALFLPLLLMLKNRLVARPSYATELGE